MSSLQDFTSATPRALPVLLLLDVSGSMEADGKIGVLNQAVEEMLNSFSEEDGNRAEIQVAVVTFGDGVAEVYQPLAPAAEVEWEPMDAVGNTPMGAALSIATSMIEDHDQIPSRAYRPTIVLVSDGRPNDAWEAPLEQLLHSDRASKAARFALAVGSDADSAMLARFIGDERVPVFEAHQARQIQQFFRWVTMSVTQRVRSVSPDSDVAMEPPSLDDFEF